MVLTEDYLVRINACMKFCPWDINIKLSKKDLKDLLDNKRLSIMEKNSAGTNVKLCFCAFDSH